MVARKGQSRKHKAIAAEAKSGPRQAPDVKSRAPGSYKDLAWKIPLYLVIFGLMVYVVNDSIRRFRVNLHLQDSRSTIRTTTIMAQRGMIPQSKIVRAIEKAHAYAIEKLESGLELEPRAYDLYYEMGTSLDFLKRYKEAIEAYEKLLEYGGVYVDTLYWLANEYNSLANIYYKSDRIEDAREQYVSAIKYFKQALDNDPYYYRAYYFLILAQKRIGEPEAAVETARTAAEWMDDIILESAQRTARVFSLNIFTLLGLIYEEDLNRPEFAAYYQGLAELSKIEEGVAAAVELAEQNNLNTTEIGLSKRRELTPVLEAAAGRHFKRAFDRGLVLPDDELIKTQMDRAMWLGAQAYEAEEEWPQAYKVYARIAELYPDNQEIYLRLVHAARRMENWQGMIEYGTKAYEYDSHNYWLTRSLGVAYEARQDLGSAVEWYTKTLQLNGEDRPAVIRMAKCLIRLNQPVPAAELTDETAADLECEIGLALLADGREEEAYSSFIRSVEKNPAVFRPWNKAIRYLVERKSWNEARKLAEKCLAGNPELPYGDFLLGVVAHAAWKPEEAEAHFMESLRKDPDFTGAYYRLGQIYEGVGRLREALLMYEKYYEKNPGDTKAKDVIKKLREAEK